MVLLSLTPRAAQSAPSLTSAFLGQNRIANDLLGPIGSMGSSFDLSSMNLGIRMLQRLQIIVTCSRQKFGNAPGKVLLLMSSSHVLFGVSTSLSFRGGRTTVSHSFLAGPCGGQGAVNMYLPENRSLSLDQRQWMPSQTWFSLELRRQGALCYMWLLASAAACMKSALSSGENSRSVDVAASIFGYSQSWQITHGRPIGYCRNLISMDRHC